MKVNTLTGIIVIAIIIIGVFIGASVYIITSDESSIEIEEKPTFQEVSVHDPSVIKDNDTYYVFGSHLSSAKSQDLMRWTQISLTVRSGNPLMPNVYEELNETFKWTNNRDLWAPDVIQLKDGKYYMYYCSCEGTTPRSALGLAVADNIEGSYKDEGVLLKSGMKGESEEEGEVYDATVHPNVIDPHTFYDENENLWMVYGSYSGGIYILKMNPDTGRPYPNQGYGKKLLGGNHARIEGPYIMYSPETEYYYLFLSYGGLTARGGYNIRVARSKNPDGPYYDPQGHNMIKARCPEGSFFNDEAIEPYGAKLIGNFKFTDSDIGLVSPGHNSAYYEKDMDKYYIFFHSRFPRTGAYHEVRVHQMFMNSENWPVIAPHRYAGETIKSYSREEISGTYQYINHGHGITSDIKKSVHIHLHENGAISGAVEGKWKMTDDQKVDLTIGGETYHGIFLRQWDNGMRKWVMTFSALSSKGISIWGSKVIEQEG